MTLVNKKVYVAGPMTGYPRWNFDAFERACRLLRAEGAFVTSPHEIDLSEGFDPDGNGEGFDLRAALERDVNSVLESDLIALLPGWEKSSGVMVEILAAQGAGIPYAPLGSVLRGEGAPAAPLRRRAKRATTYTAAAVLLVSGATTAAAASDAGPFRSRTEPPHRPLASAPIVPSPAAAPKVSAPAHREREAPVETPPAPVAESEVATKSHARPEKPRRASRAHRHTPRHADRHVARHAKRDHERRPEGRVERLRDRIGKRVEKRVERLRDRVEESTDQGLAPVHDTLGGLLG